MRGGSGIGPHNRGGQEVSSSTKALSVVQSGSRPADRGTNGGSLSPAAPESGAWWCESWSDPEVLRGKRTDILGLKMGFPHRAKRTNSPFLHISVRTLIDCIMSPHIGEGALDSVYYFICDSLPEAPLQTHPELMFSQLPGHSVAQSGDI